MCSCALLIIVVMILVPYLSSFTDSNWVFTLHYMFNKYWQLLNSWIIRINNCSIMSGMHTSYLTLNYFILKTITCLFQTVNIIWPVQYFELDFEIFVVCVGQLWINECQNNLFIMIISMSCFKILHVLFCFTQS